MKCTLDIGIDITVCSRLSKEQQEGPLIYRLKPGGKYIYQLLQ
jgi:hypothetical protein